MRLPIPHAATTSHLAYCVFPPLSAKHCRDRPLPAVNAGRLSSGFEHYILKGADEGRLPERFLFNEAYYLTTNPDVAAAVVAGHFAAGFDHFVTHGVFEGRPPSSFFNETYYRLRYPDIAAAIANGSLVSGFVHFESTGRFENRPGQP